MNTIEMPRKLTAENGAKYALIGKFCIKVQYFNEDGEHCISNQVIDWISIKDMYRYIVEKVESGEISI